MAKRVTRLGGLLAAYQRRDPAARSKLEIFLLYPGVHAVLYHRLAHWLYVHHRFFLARCVSQWNRFWTGIEIHPGATIGPRLDSDHRMGIIHGEGAEHGTPLLATTCWWAPAPRCWAPSPWATTPASRPAPWCWARYLPAAPPWACPPGWYG